MIEVLFVDDEPNLLSGLRRSLRAMNGAWNMRFADSGANGLSELEQMRADVVVSDMRMPGMDGVAFLGAVRRRWPDTVRIVMSGYSEVASAINSVGVAHRFLDKPCSPDVLARAVEQSTELQRRLEDPFVRRIAGAAGALPSPPETITALNSCLAVAEPNITDVIDIVSRDVAMTAKLLQLANSAFFGLAREVTEVREAVNYLGLVTVRDLATAVEAFRSLSHSGPILAELETHSQFVAQIASQLMGDDALAREAYSAGLMHDIGELVLLADESSLPNNDVVGHEHAGLGGYLLSLWGLPYRLVEAVVRHHDAETLLERTMSPVHAVYIAEAIADYCRGRRTTKLDHEYLDSLGVTQQVEELYAATS